MNKFFFTIDVDYTHGTDDGLSRLLEFCEQENLPATLFVAGRYAHEYPKQIKKAINQGHDIGTHGWKHDEDPEENFKSPGKERQFELISRATDAVESAVGCRPEMFRAPDLGVTGRTLDVLEDLGYRLDSSIPSRRLGLGCLKTPSQFFAPPTIYHPDRKNINLRGDHSLVEVPPSSWGVPINMSAIRTFGFRMVRWFAKRAIRRSGYLNFYVHPVEVTDPRHLKPRTHQPKRYQENLGPQNLDLLRELVAWVRSEKLEPRLLSTEYL